MFSIPNSYNWAITVPTNIWNIIAGHIDKSFLLILLISSLSCSFITPVIIIIIVSLKRCIYFDQLLEFMISL
jgi:hypothetical protein